MKIDIEHPSFRLSTFEALNRVSLSGAKTVTTNSVQFVFKLKLDSPWEKKEGASFFLMTLPPSLYALMSFVIQYVAATGS